MVIAGAAVFGLWRHVFPPLAASDGRVAIAVLPFRRDLASAGNGPRRSRTCSRRRSTARRACASSTRGRSGALARHADVGTARAGSYGKRSSCRESRVRPATCSGRSRICRGISRSPCGCYRRGRDEPWQTLSVVGALGQPGRRRSATGDRSHSAGVEHRDVDVARALRPRVDPLSRRAQSVARRARIHDVAGAWTAPTSRFKAAIVARLDVRVRGHRRPANTIVAPVRPRTSNTAGSSRSPSARCD